MVWSFLAPSAWSPTRFGNLCEHNKVMSEMELGVWLFFRWETCQVGHRQSWWLFSSTVMCCGKNWLTSERWQLQRHVECHRVKTEQSKNVLICSPIQTLMTLCASKTKQTTGCNERKTNTWLWQVFFLSLWDLIWFEVSVCTKTHYSKWNVKKKEYLDKANSC